MELRERIVVDPRILVGKPVISGTRLAVEFILDLLANGWSYDQVVSNYPGLTVDDIRACLEYAKRVVQEEHVYPLGDG